MAFTIRLHPDRPILSNTLGEKLEPGDLEAMTIQTTAQLDALDRKVYFLIDMSQTRMGFEDVMAGASAGARGLNPPLHHPNVIQPIMVTNDKLVRMAAQGINSPLFGHVNMLVVSTLEEALAYIDAHPAG